MPFRVYLGLNWKESVNDPRIFPAQYGFGFTDSGALRLPKKTLPDMLRIIDDAVLPKTVPDASTIEQLARLCSKGCLLDFERKPTQMHAAIILGLSQRLHGVPLFAAPARFLHLASSLLPLVTPPQQCTNWRDFVTQIGKRYPKGWMLELIPCKYTVHMPFSTQNSGELEDALCCFDQSDRMITYYDTKKTLEKKLILAQKNACRSAIGLYRELIEVK